jgi:pimeloyl-ACP methyl ester carboxylesterase
LLPLLDRAVHATLVRNGVASLRIATPLGSVHVYDAPGRGAGPTVVLLHGLSASAGSYAPMIARLRRRARRVIAPDFPGHGRSDESNKPLTPDLLYDTVTAVLDELLGNEAAVVIGNSLGGACAAEYAIRRPERVRGLVLLSPAGAAWSPDELDAVRRVFDVSSRRDALAFAARVQDRPPAMMHLIAHELPALFARRAVRDLLATATTEDFIDPAALGGLTMPVLLWWGQSERVLPPSHLAWFRAHLPTHAVVERPPALGHCPQLDAPRTLDARLGAFLGN